MPYTINDYINECNIYPNTKQSQMIDKVVTEISFVGRLAESTYMNESYSRNELQTLIESAENKEKKFKKLIVKIFQRNVKAVKKFFRSISNQFKTLEDRSKELLTKINKIDKPEKKQKIVDSINDTIKNKAGVFRPHRSIPQPFASNIHLNGISDEAKNCLAAALSNTLVTADEKNPELITSKDKLTPITLRDLSDIMNLYATGTKASIKKAQEKLDKCMKENHKKGIVINVSASNLLDDIEKIEKIDQKFAIFSDTAAINDDGTRIAKTERDKRRIENDEVEPVTTFSESMPQVFEDISFAFQRGLDEFAYWFTDTSAKVIGGVKKLGRVSKHHMSDKPIKASTDSLSMKDVTAVNELQKKIIVISGTTVNLYKGLLSFRHNVIKQLENILA